MRLFTLLAVGLFALTGCATGASNALVGTSWNVTAINGAAPVAGSRPTMAFTEAMVSVSTGCNSMSAGYTLNGTAMTISDGAMTAMACADDLMKQESAFTAALAKVTRMTVTGDALALQDASGQSLVTLTRAAEPTPKPLEGTTWQLEAIRTGQSTSSVVAGSTVTMQIRDGVLSGKACNTFRGQVTVDGDTVKVGPLASTKMACPSEDENRQEQTVLDMLAKATTYKITGARLELSDGADTALEFAAQ